MNSSTEMMTQIRAHPFLAGFREEQLDKLLTGAAPFNASAGHSLAREGDSADAFYLLQSGHVAIGTHLGERGAVVTQTVGPGDVVGWSWLLAPYRWQFDAVATEATLGVVLQATKLRDLFDQDTALGYTFLKRLLEVVSGRLAAARVQQLDIYR